MTGAHESASPSTAGEWMSTQSEPPLSGGLRESLIIDCDSCRMRDISCGDCVISFLIGHPAEPSPLALGDGEARAMATLAEVGLVPPLRLVPPLTP